MSFQIFEPAAQLETKEEAEYEYYYTTEEYAKYLYEENKKFEITKEKEATYEIYYSTEEFVEEYDDDYLLKKLQENNPKIFNKYLSGPICEQTSGTNHETHNVVSQEYLNIDECLAILNEKSNEKGQNNCVFNNTPQDENVYTSESNQLKNNEIESLDDESNKNIDKNPAKKSTNDEEDQNNYDH